MKYMSTLLFLLFCYFVTTNHKCFCANNARTNHQPYAYLDSEIKSLVNISDREHMRNALDHILIERVPGTPGHAIVKKYILTELEKLGMHIETDKFIENTPTFGEVEFENIIATLDPNADRFLVLAAHFDSKYFEDITFLGATDSAVPCAMLLNLVKTLKPLLEEQRSRGDSVTLQLIFFDGEEAFQDWTETDSLYGARHLAKTWENEVRLDKIDVLILLDLIGAPDPSFYSYFRETDRWFNRLINAEERLSEMGLLQRYTTGSKQQRYFKTRARFGGGIQDDHVPFDRRGVPIIHLISSPFPHCWHKEDDNLAVVDFNTVENLQNIFRVFVAEYLKLHV